MEVESDDGQAKDFLVKLGWSGNIKGRNGKPKSIQIYPNHWLQNGSIFFFGGRPGFCTVKRFTKVGHVLFVS